MIILPEESGNRTHMPPFNDNFLSKEADLPMCQSLQKNSHALEPEFLSPSHRSVYEFSAHSRAIPTYARKGDANTYMTQCRWQDSNLQVPKKPDLQSGEPARCSTPTYSS